ncbi:MAG: tetratricopeptide repeat protein [Desulfobacteraceae bacterium]
MDKKDKKDLLFHLTIIGFFLLFVFSSCSTFYFWKDGGSSGIDRTRRYMITEKDLDQFATTVRPRKKDLDSLYRQACYFQRIKKHKLALEVLEELILADLSYVKAYNAMGFSYDRLGDHPRAIEAYKRALRLDPDLAYVQNNLGYSYLLQGNLDAAVDAFKKAIELDGENARYHNNLGLAYTKKGLYDLALTEFEAAGDEAKAHHNIAKIYHRRGRHEEAEIHLAKALKLNPYSDESRKELPSTGTLAEIIGTAADKKEKGPRQESLYHTEIDDQGRKKLRFKINTDHSHIITIVDNSNNDSVIFTAKNKFKEHHSEEEKKLKDFEVEVSNGNGVNRMARRVGNYLRNKGLNVTRLTNAENFNFTDTKIYYHDDYLQDAFKVARQIPGYQQMEEIEEFGRQAIKIKLIIGKDIVPYDPVFRKNDRES